MERIKREKEGRGGKEREREDRGKGRKGGR